jgi:hypothetical protein
MEPQARTSLECAICDIPTKRHFHHERKCKICRGEGEIIARYDIESRDFHKLAAMTYRIRCVDCRASSESESAEDDAWATWYKFNQREDVIS